MTVNTNYLFFLSNVPFLSNIECPLRLLRTGQTTRPRQGSFSFVFSANYERMHICDGKDISLIIYIISVRIKTM